MYSVTGEPVPVEQELAHLAGHRGSGPVRIGNGARNQLQLDTTGALVDAAFLYESSGARSTSGSGVTSVGSSTRSARTGPNPTTASGSPRAPVRHNVHSKLMSWVALDRGRRLAPLFGDREDEERWRAAAARIRDEILSRGLDPEGRHFVNAFGGSDADAALLLIPATEFLPASDPRVAATIDWIRERLGDGHYLYRYRADDGVGGPVGAFVLCGFWLTEALALADRIEEAQEVFVAHAEASNHLGLLAEEIDPSTGELLGNFPQAFSHLGLINAASRIDLGLRRRDEGSGKIPRSPLHESGEGRTLG